MIKNHNSEVYESLKPNDIGDEQFNDRPEIRTTVREYLKLDYQESLDVAAEVGDTEMLEAALGLLQHRGYDDPIIVRESEDGYWVVTHG